ncbi:YciI family protein [Microlunatus sp. GCM10028923]|uniref:YciI family protein n=1 Tax=Microlunatus sp. GCM10028923 TaxID=3273400 RepID=UPI003620D8DD
MQFLISVMGDETGAATPEELAATDEFNQRLEAAGQFVFGDGLAAPSTATVVDGRGEAPVLTDGPFLETKEYLAGFWIIEAPDRETALKLAAEGSKACNGVVEVRPFQTL